MGVRQLVFAAGLVFSGLWAPVAQAGQAQYFEPEYGATSPPIGFVKFCASSPGECKDVPHAIIAPKVAMTPENWETLFRINSQVNRDIRAVSDLDLYGVSERWTYPNGAGDCEDFVLLKKKLLMEQGLPARALLITVVLDEKGEGHAVLTVATKLGDYVLDNRRDQILRWGNSGYTYLKRQSAKDPMQWVALSKRRLGAGNPVASRASKTDR